MKVTQRKLKDANKILVIKSEGKKRVCVIRFIWLWLAAVNTAINIHVPHNVANSRLGWMTKLL
jgi:hypothetical protein